MDDFEGVFEKKISRFIWAKCHIKLNDAIYMYKLLDLKFSLPIFFGQVISYIVKHIKELRVKILEWT